MSAHTPGPWTYDLSTEEIVAANGTIGRCEPASGPLMAAAPDLLDACKLAVDRLDSYARNRRNSADAKRRESADLIERALRSIAAAIAKAEGK